MGIGVSLFLIAIGAVLRFAVHVSSSGFDIHTIGLIVMLVGIAGLVISLLMLVAWTDRTRGWRGGVVREREVAPVREREREIY